MVARVRPAPRAYQPRIDGHTIGRAKGTRNKITTLVKDAIERSGNKLGMLVPVYKTIGHDYRGKGKLRRKVPIKMIIWEPTGEGGLEGYLIWLATTHPQAYASLLARVLPIQIQAKIQDPDTPRTRFANMDPGSMSLNELIGAYREVVSLTQKLPPPPPRPALVALSEPGPVQEAEVIEGEAT